MKKIYQRIFVLGLVSIVGFMTSCEKDYFVPAPPTDPNDSIPIDSISYSMDMQPYFDAQCTKCHNGGGIPLDLSPGVSYDAIINGGYVNTSSPASSNLYVKIAPGGSMEQYSTSAETSMTLQWIDEGAVNN